MREFFFKERNGKIEKEERKRETKEKYVA